MESVTWEAETPIRVEHDRGRVTFGILAIDLPVLTSADGVHRPRERISCYPLDPLTSRGGEGLRVSRPESVLAVEKIARLPVTREFLIDSAATFSWNARARYGLPEVPEAFAGEFLRALVAWLASHEPPLIQAGGEDGLRIRNTDLTELGLDFLRQHYHKLKEQALARQRVPSPAELQRLLAETERHRTTDDDWRCESEKR